MGSYNYIRISINFQFLSQLLIDHKIILTVDYFYATFNIAFTNFIICRIEKRWVVIYEKTNIEYGELQLHSYLHQFSIVVATAGRT